MTKISIILSDRERLVIDFKETPRKTVLVRGHFRSVGDKKVYVRTHYRNK